MQLQLALTQMETMADMLNERKRESDQAHAVKRILRHVSAKSAAKSLSEGSRFLLREDTLTQLVSLYSRRPPTKDFFRTNLREPQLRVPLSGE